MIAMERMMSEPSSRRPLLENTEETAQPAGILNSPAGFLPSLSMKGDPLSVSEYEKKPDYTALPVPERQKAYITRLHCLPLIIAGPGWAVKAFCEFLNFYFMRIALQAYFSAKSQYNQICYDFCWLHSCKMNFFGKEC